MCTFLCAFYLDALSFFVVLLLRNVCTMIAIWFGSFGIFVDSVALGFGAIFIKHIF